MRWFCGEVVKAIQECRRESSLFIVFVHDDSQASSTTEAMWNAPEVQEVLSVNKFVALRISKDSVQYHQFSQLFPVFIFPSVFCIGLKGQSLVVMNGGQTSSQMRDKMAEAFEKLRQEQSETTPTAPPPTQSPPTAVRNGPLTPPPPTPTPPTSHPGTTGADSEGLPEPAAVDPPSMAAGGGTSEPAASGRSKEETLKHYQEQIRKRRQEKAEEAAQKEKRQEIDRRKLGQSVAEIKQKQEEQRNQSWIQERQRQKEEAKRAREEIKARVELDRLERQAQQREQKAAASELRQRSAAAAPVTSSVFSTVSTGGSCRIQLRLPAGSTSVVELDRNGTLRDLREAAAQVLSEAPTAVLLTSLYPRRELVAELDSQSLAELQLVPSGVVIVRLTRGVSSSLQSGEGGVVSSLWGALVGLLQLIVGFLAYIKSSVMGLFGGSSEPAPSSSQQGARQREEARVRKFRQEDFRDDDKDRSTYNGNSTQQQ